jgi:YesN/AraC family two-component response regulator
MQASLRNARDNAMTQPTVVIADDVTELRQLLSRTLETLGFHVVAQAKNGSDALSQIEANEPDLCFLDIDMPELSGLQVLDELQNKRLTTYSVIISGHSSLPNVKQAIANGAKAFIVKPYTFEKIKQTTESYFETLRKN